MNGHPGAILIAILIFMAPVSVRAEGVIEEARGGILAQSCCGLGNDKEQGVGVNAEVVFSSPEFLSILGSPRPLVGATVATDSDATSQIYAGLEWRINVHPRWFVSAGGGGAIHNGETDDFDPVADANRVTNTLFLGCRALFRINGDMGYRINDRFNAMFSWSHISNAGLCRENEGLDHMGFRFGYRF